MSHQHGAGSIGIGHQAIGFAQPSTDFAHHEPETFSWMPQVGILRDAIVFLARHRQTELEAGSNHHLLEWRRGEHDHFVSPFSQTLSDTDERMMVAARADWSHQKAHAGGKSGK